MNTNHCLDQTTASQLVLGTLQPEEATESEEHLLQCDSCLQLVESTRVQDGLVSALQTSEPQGDTLDAEVDAMVADLDLLARPAQTAASAYTEVEPLLCDTDTNGQMGRFANYRILEILGSGGMGIVLKAEDEVLGRTVALKLMRPSLAVNEQAKQRFRREAKAIAAFEHNHIVTVYDVEEHNGTPYFTMEWLEGESLRDRLHRAEKISMEETLRITREITTGLAAAHARGLLHRDIKPDNIWLQSPHGEVKILDFGLVHSIESSASLTHSGAIVGTPEYMAPEQACGEAIDQRCDLFSVGCVLYHMLTGRPPFQGKNVVATLVAISNAKVKSPKDVEPAVPQSISDVAVKLLQRDPEQRFESAETLTAEIEKLEADHAVPRPLAKSPSRLGWWPLLLALGTAAVLAGVIAVKTNHGTLYIDTGTNADVTALVEGETVELRDKKTNKEFTLTVGASKLKPGQYEIVANEEGNDLQFSSREFQLRRGEHQVIRAWLDDGQKQMDEFRAKNSDVAIQLQNARTYSLLERLRENKDDQAVRVHELQKLVKKLSQDLNVTVDEYGRPFVPADQSLKKTIDAIAATEYEIDELSATIEMHEEQIHTGNIHSDLVSESTIPEIQRLREKLRVKEAAVAKIEATFTDPKESNEYENAIMALEMLKKEVPEQIRKIKNEAAQKYAGYQLYEKKTQLSQKQNLLQRLEERRAEMAHEMQSEGNIRLEYQFASEELQRALALFAKISERESQLSATVGLPKELADQLWGDYTSQPETSQPDTQFGSPTSTSRNQYER